MHLDYHYSALPDPLAGFKGPTHKGSGGKGKRMEPTSNGDDQGKGGGGEERGRVRMERVEGGRDEEKGKGGAIRRGL